MQVAEIKRHVRDLKEDLGLLPERNRPLVVGFNGKREKGKEKEKETEEEKWPERWMALPPEIQVPTLMFALIPSWRRDPDTYWVYEPVSAMRHATGGGVYISMMRQYMENLSRSYYDHLDMGDTLRETRQIREIVLSPQFVRSVYRSWFSRAREGLDGTPDQSTVPSPGERAEMTPPQFAVDPNTGLVKNELWHRDFMQAALMYHMQEWKVMAAVRLWRFLFLTRRIARSELATTQLDAPSSLPAGEDRIESRLPATPADLVKQYPEYVDAEERVGTRPWYHWFHIYLSPETRPALLDEFFLLNDFDATPEQVGNDPNLPGMTADQQAETASIINLIKSVLREIGAAAPGVLSIVLDNPRALVYPTFDYGTDTIGDIALNEIFEDEMYTVGAHLIPTFSGVPITDAMLGGASYNAGYNFLNRIHNIASYVVLVQKPVDLGIVLYPNRPTTQRQATMFCIGGIAMQIMLDLTVVHIGNPTAFSDMLVRFLLEHPGRRPVENFDHLIVNSRMCSYAPMGTRSRLLPQTEMLLWTPYQHATIVGVERGLLFLMNTKWEPSDVMIDNPKELLERRAARDAQIRAEMEHEAEEDTASIFLPWQRPPGEDIPTWPPDEDVVELSDEEMVDDDDDDGDDEDMGHAGAGLQERFRGWRDRSAMKRHLRNRVKRLERELQNVNREAASRGILEGVDPVFLRGMRKQIERDLAAARQQLRALG